MYSNVFFLLLIVYVENSEQSVASVYMYTLHFNYFYDSLSHSHIIHETNICTFTQTIFFYPLLRNFHVKKYQYSGLGESSFLFIRNDLSYKFVLELTLEWVWGYLQIDI